MKKNLRKIPKEIIYKLKNFDNAQFVAAVVKQIAYIDIQNGLYKNLGIKSHLIIESFLPLKEQGRFSFRNIEGRSIPRKDLPKISKSRSMYASNWRGSGFHEVVINREVYQRDNELPPNLKINVEIISENPNQDLIVKFSVDKIFTQSDPNLDHDLLFALNLLQENFGVCDIFGKNDSFSELVNNIIIDWEILPPGNREENIIKISSSQQLSSEEFQVLTERYDFLNSFKPVAIIRGLGQKYGSYFGAKFTDNFVVFDNLKRNNAVYIMFEDWEKYSQKTKLELISNSSEDKFIRVPHKGEWKNRVRKIIEKKLEIT